MTGITCGVSPRSSGRNFKESCLHSVWALAILLKAPSCTAERPILVRLETTRLEFGRGRVARSVASDWTAVVPGAAVTLTAISKRDEALMPAASLFQLQITNCKLQMKKAGSSPAFSAPQEATLFS